MGRYSRKVKIPSFFYRFTPYIHSVSSEEDKPADQENPRTQIDALLPSLIAYLEESYADIVVETSLARVAHDGDTRRSVFLSTVASQDDARTLSFRSSK
jgi:hypothetical protein